MNYDRVILELIERVSFLEDEVKKLKERDNTLDEVRLNEMVANSTNSRDTTKYMFEGKKYGKNRLVLAIIKKYVEMNPKITATELLSTFDKSLQGSLGVVRILEDVQVNCKDYEMRFFTATDEIIETSTDKCVVCTQWGIGNIDYLISRAQMLGMEINSVM